MNLHDTSDISDDVINKDLNNANYLYANILASVYAYQTIETKKKAAGIVESCCSPEQLSFLRRLVRLFMGNVRTTDGRRIPPGYAAAAILYYYYQLVLIETGFNTFLDLKYLRLYKMTPDEIRRLHSLTNLLITSDEPYIVEIRKSILNFNKEPFVGGKKRRRKNGSRHNR